jgi:phospholipase/carboxylesterase
MRCRFLWRGENAPMDISTLARLPASGAPELLFLLFHGAGSDARSMTDLAQRLGLEYPQSAVLCVEAPLNSATQSDARHWFQADDLTTATQALPSFIAMVRELQSRFGVGWERSAVWFCARCDHGFGGRAG